jgi:hypothetical protein
METSIRRDFDLFSWKSSIVLNWLRDSGQMIGIEDGLGNFLEIKF